MTPTQSSTSAGTDILTARSIVESGDMDVERRMREAAVLDETASLLTLAGSALWDAAYRELAKLLREFLGFDLAAVMLTGWRKYEELVAAGEKTRGNRQVVVVDLAGRDLRLVQEPKVDLVLGQRTLTTLTFSIQVDVKVTALAAVVRNGELKELTSGRCEVTVAVSVDDTELAKKTRDYDPKLVVPLGGGMALTAL